jgi:hypothetical protein
LRGQVALAEESAQRGKLLRDFASVKPDAALRTDRLQRSREVRVS